MPEESKIKWDFVAHGLMDPGVIMPPWHFIPGLNYWKFMTLAATMNPTEKTWDVYK